MCLLSCSVVSKSLQPHGLKPRRLFCPWNFPGKSTGVRCHCLLQGIFPTQGLNLPLHISLHCWDDSLPCATWEAWWLELQWLYCNHKVNLRIEASLDQKRKEWWQERQKEPESLRNLWNYRGCVLSRSSGVWLFATLWTVVPQPSLTLGFSRQEYWSALHAFLQGIFWTQESNLGLLHCRHFLYWLSYEGSPLLPTFRLEVRKETILQIIWADIISSLSHEQPQ